MRRQTSDATAKRHHGWKAPENTSRSVRNQDRPGRTDTVTTMDHHPLLVGTDIAADIVELIGRTPIVAMPRLSEAEGLTCLLTMKHEALNPGGSSKDRPALNMILDAERSGLLQPGGTIVEPTSGNTGVGLAIVAAQRGYKCVFVLTDKVAPEKVSLLKAYGAEVVVCPVAVAPEDPRSYYKVAERLTHELGAYRPNQYANPANPAAHEASTGPEIWEQTAGRITHFIAGAGTSGTITGVARYLKAKNPNIKIIAADPGGSVFSGGSGRPYLVEGIGEDFYPAAWDRDLYDEVIEISDAESFATARRVSSVEGILIGGSGGTAVAAALKVARTLGPDDLVVVLNPDSGRGYLSRVFDDGWMEANGFATGRAASEETVGDLLACRGETPQLLYVNPHETVRVAIERMQHHEISQMPICELEPPFALAEVRGAVDEIQLLQAARQDPAFLDTEVGFVIGPKLPQVGAGAPLNTLAEVLRDHAAVLVAADGRPVAVLTRSDLLRHLSHQAHG